jgi:cytochrome P450
MDSAGVSSNERTTGCPVAHTAAGFSFFEREYQEDPGASLAWARESQPVFYNDDSDYWVVTRYQDVKSVFRQFNQYSAANTLTPVTPASEEAAAQLRKYNFTPCPVLVDADPPVHRQYRRLNAPAFRPDRIEPLAPYIRTTTSAYIDRFIEQGHADLIADLLWDIPCLVALHFMGIPEEDVDTVRKLATSMTEFVWGRPSPEEQVRAADGMGQFWEMGERVIGKLKELDDPPGWLGHAIKMQREHPDVITDTWLQTNVMAGAMAAHETTTNATANAIVALLRNRDQWDRLCADPSLIPAAVEECLRLSPSVTAWRRVAKQDVQVGDVTIPAGGKILMVIASANQDASVFDDPERFDIGRDNKAHIAFGFGTHTCLGIHLARLEMVIYLEELTRRLPHMTLDEQELRYLPNTSFRGPESLHVSWDVEKNPATSGVCKA